MGQHQRIIDELKTFERLCFDMAQKSTLPLEQSALLEMAANCRAEAARCQTGGGLAVTWPGLEIEGAGFAPPAWVS